jgi:predicted TPR repeat methyltransferase
VSSSKDSVQRAHQLGGDAERITEYYQDWADSYDQDLSDEHYRGPEMVGEAFGEVAGEHLATSPERTTVLDAGCGTGLVGVVLAGRGVTTIDGFDLSQAMVDVAEKTGVYRRLEGGVDMNDGLTGFPDNGYDVSVSCGVFTLGHVPPEALLGLLRVTAPGGIVIVSTRKSYAAESGFEEYVRRLEEQGGLKTVLRLRDKPYTADSPADYWAFKVLKQR